MRIQVNASALGETKWHEYAVRFLLGGAITALAGIIAKQFGSSIGGLFLAFPAIFPASATLVQKHEQQKKEERGLEGVERGKDAASVDAAGSAIGTIGLFAFALLAWRFLPSHEPWLVLTAATVAWLIISALVWHIRKRT